MPVIRSFTFAVFGASVLLGALAACESAINLDVAYRDASVTSDATDEGGEAGTTPSGVELEACPCDEAQGFGCCVTNNGPSFCTLNSDQCANEKGVFMKCFRPSATAESACCWHTRPNEPPVAAYAGYCDAGPAACVDDNDCRGAQSGSKCLTRLCGGQTIGNCGPAGGALPPCL